MAVLYRLPNLRAENFHSAPRACASTSSAVRIVALRQNLFSISRWIIVFGGKLEQRAWHAVVHYRSTIVHLSLVYECLNPLAAALVLLLFHAFSIVFNQVSFSFQQHDT